MKYYIDRQGDYYEGDIKHPKDIEVVRRPSHLYDWNGTQWIINVSKEAINQRRIQDLSEEEIFKTDTQLQAILDMTPVQVESWIDANVTSLTEARTFLKRLTKLTLATARKVFR